MISLAKGQKVSLTKEAPNVTKVLVGLGWDANEKSGGFFGGHAYDLDASAFMLRDGKLSKNKDIIYFGNTGRNKDAIYHHGDNLTGDGDGDDEQISVRLDKLDSSVDRVVFVVNIYDAKHRKQSFGNVKNAFIRLVDETSDKELFRYNLSDGSCNDCSSLIFAELYRHNGEWKFNPIGEGSKANSVQELADRYR